MTTCQAIPPNPEPTVTLCADVPHQSLTALMNGYGLSIEWVTGENDIPGSHFGEPEAGLIGSTLYLRTDSPIHSALHEACHYICMDSARRSSLHTDAGGDYDEENAVCYLSILLADEIEQYNSQQMMSDMNTWGYTFRLGSAEQWFEHDAEDARSWLITEQLIDDDDMPTGQLRS